MRKIFQAFDSFSEKFGKVVSFIVWIGAIILFIEVFLRYFFNAPTVWAHGYTQRFFGSYFVLIGAFTLVNKGHVRVDVIINRFPFRARKLMDMLNMGMLLVWCFVLTYEGWAFFINSWKVREVDQSALAHPVYPVKFILVIGVVMMGLQGLSHLCQDFLDFIEGEPAKDKSLSE